MRSIIKIFGKLLAPTANRFLNLLKNPQAAQQSTQRQIFSRLLNSEYGRDLRIKAIEDWQQLPIVTYQDIEHLILKQIKSKNNILTSEKTIFYEKTSGSRGAAKSIPYTKSLRSSFNYMFCLWAHDLITNGLPFSTGKIYFCISPPIANLSDNSSDLSIGLQDDSEYLDRWLRWVLSPFLVLPPGIDRLLDVEEFKDALAKTLLKAEDLEIISIWNPSFLKVHLDYIQTHQIRLHAELKDRISSQRQALLLESQIPWPEIWSELKLISCWDSANAAEQANYLRSLFPSTTIQGKGLLATEAPMTIPFIAARGCVPLLNEVFFEFEDDRGQIYRLHELEIGSTYEIIISQKGGLYRYRIGDRIRVNHYYLNTPCLEFIGRTQTTSDLVGEKLHEDFVKDVLDNLQLEGTFFKSLIPVMQPAPHYILLLDRADRSTELIAQQLDEELRRSHHYRYARLLEQLLPARVLVSPQIPDLMTAYYLRLGRKWGDIKHQILVTQAIDVELLKQLEI
ncbi:MAG: GH3 auxin-responsive promoter family protein [Cyanosarcina radialis HA8281-LM2]|jgi:hypothetical protein|nr:GH3 auxin-responsive promoter family protein [Cyanosarcina radialis HA8281-LM2]